MKRGNFNMTIEEKSTIESLRSQGYGYKKIASETGISEGTVKSYFHRTKKPGTAPIVQIKKPNAPIERKRPADDSVAAKPCLFCGKPVAQNPGRREKKFCSDSCRSLWWNRHKYTVPRKSNRTFICQSCGAEFSAYGATDRKYCSHACYIHGRFHGGIVCG